MDTELKVKIEFAVNIGDLSDVDLNELANQASNDRYTDGRKDFNVEMMEHSLVGHMKNVITSCLNKKYRDIYGNKMVEVSLKSSTAKAVVEAEKEMKEIKYVYTNFISVEVEKEED